MVYIILLLGNLYFYTRLIRTKEQNASLRREMLVYKSVLYTSTKNNDDNNMSV